MLERTCVSYWISRFFLRFVFTFFFFFFFSSRRRHTRCSRDWSSDVCSSDLERARTGIGSLKVRYNRVFGYYIEVSKSNLANVPADYHRKQTIAGGERFITPALKLYEDKVLGADERILERELEIFDALRARVAGEAPRAQDTARGLAALDALSSLADTAAANNYTKP